jgi:hypothetical protein
MKFLKVGRVAIITHGRYAGKKVRYTDAISTPDLKRQEKRGQARLRPGRDMVDARTEGNRDGQRVRRQ